jgi:putative membrane protein
MFAFASFLFADTAVPTPTIYNDFHYFGMAVLSTIVFGVIGIVLAIIGFKLFDMLTPGKLEEEIIQKQNVAAAILGAAIILGICLIVSRAVGS